MATAAVRLDFWTVLALGQKGLQGEPDLLTVSARLAAFCSDNVLCLQGLKSLLVNRPEGIQNLPFAFAR